MLCRQRNENIVGPKWKRDRRLMSPLFLKRNVIQYFPYILHHMKILVNRLQKKVNQPTFNIEHMIHRCATDFVNETIIGTKTNAQAGELETFVEHLTRSYTVVHARMVKVWLQVEWIFRFTKYWKQQEEGKKVIHGFFRQVIKKVEENHVCTSKTDHSFRNLLEQMLDIRDEVPDFATNEELVHHLSTLYSASEDTVTTIVSFALVILGMYPNIQNKVAEEIFNVVGDRDIEETDLDRLVYLDMVIKDVLRLFPIAPYIAREAAQDYQLGLILIDKWMIPKGCTVIVAIHNIHRDGKLWEKPNEFYPEHFLPEAVHKRHPYAFMPF
ncbi:hypothetical protein NQ314_015578 [Rhamnusium bicolor]|uniref:Cytochrome P450 n=1 Tax=Rhamnusium bicolor TaxID=1586634 RepID=A0AAV8WZD0_9CUCU|nr:hypothetical protein NQ314_015578 [Rhamnusium bicolor]